MNTIKKKSMHVAVMAGLAAIGAAGTAEAVHISPDGLGQVLVFPYYTVRGGQNTLITLINTQNNTKIVKIRFLEGKNSREVLDFNIFMSPADVWTGAVIQTALGAKVVSNDNTCVTPSDLFRETRTDSNNVQFLNEFKNYQYGSNNGLIDNASMSSLDRSREGYFEVIEMGVIDDDLIDTGVTAATTAATVTGHIKHNSAGVPANCPALDALDAFVGNLNPIQFPNTGATIVPVGNLTQPPRGGLAGRASIINPTTGANYSYSPTAFDAWTNSVAYFSSGDLRPAIYEAFPATSNVFTSAGVVTTTWPATVQGQRDAMSATMMRNTVINEFILDAATASKTDWVVTFPTKRAYVGLVTAGQATPPFSQNFPNSNNLGSCDPYGFSVFNREEGPVGSSPLLLPPVSPLPPAVGPAAGAALCWEANVVPFKGPLAADSLLASTNTSVLLSSIYSTVNGATTVGGSATSPAPIGRGTQGPNGYFIINFNNTVVSAVAPFSNAQTLVAPAAGTTRTPLGAAPGAAFAATYNGLPVVGFMVHNYQNAGVSSQYGGLVDHKFTRSITP